MGGIENKGFFTAYVALVLWYIFMSGSLILRPFTSVAWVAFAMIGFAFKSVSSKENVSGQVKKFFLLGFVFLISCLYSIDIEASVKYFVTIVMFFFIVYFITNTPEKIHIVLKVSFAYLLFLCAVTYIQMFLPNTYVSVFLPFLPYKEEILFFMDTGSMCGFTNQTGSNAFYMVLGMALSFFLFKKKGILKYTLLLLFFIALLATGRRGPTIIAAVLFLLVGFEKGAKSWAQRIIVLFIIGYLLIYLSTYVPYISNVTEKFITLSESGNLLNGRLEVFEKMLEGISENALLGHGIASLPQYMNREYGVNIFSHNAYLQYAFEVGMLGTLVVIICILSPVKKLFSFLSSREYKEVRFFLFMQLFLLSWAFVESAFYDQYRFFILMFFEMASLTIVDYDNYERRELCPEPIKH